jgi:tyrosyl-tRNA synthetase
MSKSLGNYVGIAEPPEEIFGKLMSISDELMWRYIELLSFAGLDEIAKWKTQVEAGRNPRDIKVAFAREVAARFHGEAAAERAQANFEARFREGVLPEDMPEFSVAPESKTLPLVQVLKRAGLTTSTSEALRLIGQGGVRVNGEKISDKGLELAAGESYVLQIGKRKFARVKVA